MVPSLAVALPARAGEVAAHDALGVEARGLAHQHAAPAQPLGMGAERRRELVGRGREHVVRHVAKCANQARLITFRTTPRPGTTSFMTTSKAEMRSLVTMNRLSPEIEHVADLADVVRLQPEFLGAAQSGHGTPRGWLGDGGREPVEGGILGSTSGGVKRCPPGRAPSASGRGRRARQRSRSMPSRSVRTQARVSPSDHVRAVARMVVPVRHGAADRR